MGPNTINRSLKLSDNHRKVTFGVEGQRHKDHPDTFEKWSQLMCENALTDGATGKWNGGAMLISQ